MKVEGESLPLASASKLSSATPSAGDTPATPPETGKQLLDRIIEERKNKLSHGLDFANAKLDFFHFPNFFNISHRFFPENQISVL